MVARKLTWMVIALLLGPVASELIVAQQPTKAPKEKAVSKEEADEPVRLETSLVNVAVRVTDRQGVETGPLLSKLFKANRSEVPTQWDE